MIEICLDDIRECSNFVITSAPLVYGYQCNECLDLRVEKATR